MELGDETAREKGFGEGVRDGFKVGLERSFRPPRFKPTEGVGRGRRGPAFGPSVARAVSRMSDLTGVRARVSKDTQWEEVDSWLARGWVAGTYPPDGSRAKWSIGDGGKVGRWGGLGVVRELRALMKYRWHSRKADRLLERERQQWKERKRGNSEGV